jgi:hypothetical protein
VAVLWRLDSGGTRYEVRSHGATRRLLSDGVFHSAWNPRAGLTGRVWDLFLAAAFTLAVPPARILVLGVGAGTALLQFRRFIDPAVLVGVELNPVHLAAGRQFFGLDEAGATLVEADARDWVRGWEGPPFDLVVDDLFGHGPDGPARAVPMTRAWAGALSRIVAPAGALVVNSISRRELMACAQLAAARPPAARRRAGYASGFLLQGPRDHNAVGVFCRQPSSSAETRARLRRHPQLGEHRREPRLAYAMRRLW